MAEREYNSSVQMARVTLTLQSFLTDGVREGCVAMLCGADGWIGEGVELGVGGMDRGSGDEGREQGAGTSCGGSACLYHGRRKS